MNSFGAPSMQRRTAMIGGGTPQKNDFGASRGGGSNNRGRFGNAGRQQQPQIAGDFLSEDQSDFGGGTQSYGPGGGFMNRGGGQNSRFSNNRPPTGDNAGGQFRGNSADDPYDNNFGGGGYGAGNTNSNFGGQQRFGSSGGGNSMSKTFSAGGRGGGGGFGRGGATRTSGGFSGRGGRGSGLGADNSMNRYGSQQSLAYSQNSYGNQDGGNRFGGGSGLSRLGTMKQGPGQMGRTMGNTFRPPTGGGGFGRQNSIGGGFQGRFGNTMNSRSGGMQNRSSMGGRGQDSMAYLDSVDDNRFRQIVQEMAMKINQACQQQGLAQPADFFENYDPWAGRAFEDWELQILFQLPLDEINYFIDKTDDDGSRQVPIGILFTNLYQFVNQLNINDINRKQRSIWEQKKKILSRDMAYYQDIAVKIMQSFSSRDSYKDAFDMIQEEKFQTLNQEQVGDFQDMQEQYVQAQINLDEIRPFIMPAQFLVECLANDVSTQQLRPLLEYICLGRQSDQIFIVHFVRALQLLRPDSLTRAPHASSPDLLAGHSVDRTSLMDGANLDQMLMVLPESIPDVSQNPIMQKVAEHLDSNSADMAKMATAFPSAKQVLVKTGIGQTQEVECCTKKEFEAFLKALKEPLPTDTRKEKPLLELGQINVILSLYAAELPQAAPPAQPAPAPAPAQAPASVLQPDAPVQNASVEEAQPELEQDQPEGALQPSAAEEEKKAVEEEKQPFQRADTDFERDDSVIQLNASKSIPEMQKQDATAEEGKAEESKPAEESKVEEAVKPVEEQKEGGELEYYEGGNTELINLQKFKADIEGISQLTRSKAKELILEIFERIKKWITLTTKSIKLLFRNQDKKRKLEVNENDLRLVLNKAVRPFKIMRKHLQAILKVMGDGVNLRYERFTTAFFDYANQKQIFDNHPLGDIIETVREFTEGKSLVALLSRTDDVRIREDPNFKFEVPFKTFTQKIKRHRGRIIEIDRSQEQELEKLITSSDKPGVIDLVKLQELMGFKEQELYNVEGNQYRKIAMNLQIKLYNFDQVRKIGTQGQRVRNGLLPKGLIAENWINNGVIDIQSDEEYNQLMGMMQEYDDGHQQEVNVQKFLGRIEREMYKYAQIQRFYLLIMKKKDDRKKKMHIEFEDIEEFLRDNGLDDVDNEISMDDFKEILLSMDLIGTKDENWDYFREDFFPEAEPKVELKKFEADYKEISENINNVIHMILQIMDNFCKNELNKKDGSLKEQLSRIQRINQVQLLSSNRGNRNEQKQNQNVLWLHTFDFQRWFQTQIIPQEYNQYNPEFDREVLNVFTLYMSRSEEQKNMIFMPFLLQNYIERFPDFYVEQELSEEALPTLIRYVCKVLDKVNKKPIEFFFQETDMQDWQFIRILEDEPFNTSNECEFPTSLESVVKSSSKIRGGGFNSSYINVQRFKALLEDQIQKLMIRSQELLRIRKQLDERGVKIERALEQVKNSNDNIEDQGIELIDLAQLCKMAEVKLDPQTQLIPIMDTFEKNIFGEIPATDLIQAFNNAHIGMFEDEAVEEEEPLVNAKRYFVTPQEILQEIGAEINDRGMKDFGSLLKGNDLFHEGKIPHQRFFQVLKSVFNETLGEGDILDTIKIFDPQNTGSIPIRQVARVLNEHIPNRENQIRLVSFVDECVEENIVEPVSPRSRAKKDGEEDAEQPEQYRKQMLLDIHCGSQIKAAGDHYIWFNTYASFKPGVLNKNEFVIGLERLGVEDTLGEKEEAFKYFLKKVAIKNDKLAEFHKVPISQQNLPVEALNDILNEDMPGISMSIIQDRLLWKIAQWLTERKFPVVDVLKNYDSPTDGQMIDVNTFAVNVLEEDLEMKDILTRNMIQVLVRRYDQGQTTFDYRNFINDLEIVEEQNRVLIRIFKTQAEINFFQTQGQDDNMDAESYRRNRYLVEPLKEPVYESLTHKNTYFKPTPDELSGYMNSSGTMQNNFMMMEGYNQENRPMTPPNQAPRPQLEFSFHKHMDELILQTRASGVSIEGYFQRFGKFSTQDGIRKVDNKQFCTAIINLDGMEWAKEKPYEMDKLFDAIIIAFENFNQTKPSAMLNGTYQSNGNSFDRQSSPDKEVAMDQGAPKLTLEQLGQIAYYNSSVDLDTVEANALQQLHVTLYEQGMLDKLQDMVTFMNWERDSSCQLNQFKSLLLDAMRLKGKFDEHQLTLLLQRYRLDEYKTAKEQRNELASLSSNHRAVIKQGFANIGKQLIQILGCYHDLGYMQRKIGVKDQWACTIAEDIVKAYQVKLFEDRQLPMTDNDVPSQMHSYFLRMCQSADALTLSDFSYMMTSMKLWDGEVHARSRMEDFFKICQMSELAESSFFTPNTMDIARLALPSYIPTQQFTKAFEFLSRKPLSFMYQDIIDKFYVISKRQHISIWGHTIIHMFDYDDLEESGYIHWEYFVQRVQEFLHRKVIRANDRTAVAKDITDHDLRFLATKYMQRDGSGMVHYVGFLDDYDMIEQCGLGGTGVNQLSTKDTAFRRDIALKQSAEATQSWRVKTVGELTPPESKELYIKMSRYLSKKELTEPLCLSMVNIDPERDGFLEKHLIGDVVARQGMKLSFKQLTLLTQVLVMNAKQEHSYLEMIALLAGEAMMYQIMRENGIQFGGAQTAVPKKIDMSLLVMSKELKDQIELKYNLLNGIVQQLTRGSQMIRDQELFKVLKQADISFDMADIDILEQYLTFQRNQENNTINFRVFLENFQITTSTSDLLTEIVRQLTSKKVVIEEVTSQRRFTFDEFRDLLTRVEVRISDDKIATMQKLFEQMCEGQEALSRARMIECFGTEFTNIGKPQEKQRKNNRTLPEPPYAVNAMLAFLVNRKINLLQVFVECIQSKRIRIVQLRELLDQYNYQLNAGDFEAIVRFFRPPQEAPRSGRGSARDSARMGQSARGDPRQTFGRSFNQRQRDQSRTMKEKNRSSQEEPLGDTLNLGKIVAYARRVDPNYGKDEVVPEGARGTSKTLMTAFPQRIKAILKKFSDYMIDNHVSKEALFEELDRNGDGRVALNELIQFTQNIQLLEGVPTQDVEILFSFLDTNQDGSISINEFCMLVQGIMLSIQARMKSFSFEFDAKLKTEIETLFDRLDTDRNNSLTADELVQMSRPTDQSGSITLDKAHSIIRQLDTDGNGRISKVEFVKYFMPRQKRQILDFEDQMEDLRRLFKEQIAEGVASDPSDNRLDLLNSNQFISRVGLKNLIVKAGYKDITASELDSIFAEMDADKSGTIDIDEFIAFVQVADRVKTKNTQARDAVFNIRKARLKLNSIDLFEMFLKMPLSFLPSFSMREIESRKHNLPIHGIQFHFNHQTMQYLGLEKMRDLRLKRDQPKLYIAQYKPKVGLEVQLTGEAVSVPLIQRLKPEYELPHFEVRAVLFDMAQKVYLSNFYILGAEALRRQPAKNKSGPAADDQKSANLRYDAKLSTFYLASDQLENVNASLVFEFVIYSNNTMAIDPLERKEKSNQVTVGWTHVPITKLATSVKHKLDLKGGNPFHEQELFTTEDAEQPKQSQGLLKKIFGGGGNTENKVQRYMTLEAKPMAKLAEPVQLELSSLPSGPLSCIVCKPLLSLVVAFRNHCYLLLTKHEQEMTQPSLDLVMVQFPKIYNSPDFQAALADCWSGLTFAGADAGVDSQLKLEKLTQFVTLTYSVMFEQKVKLDPVYPTRSSPLNSKQYRARQIALKSALMSDNEPFMQKVRQEILADNTLSANEKVPSAAGVVEEAQEGETLFMEDYVPFAMGELCGNINAFDGDDAIAGLSVFQEQNVNEMERKYAADGLYI